MYHAVTDRAALSPATARPLAADDAIAPLAATLAGGAGGLDADARLLVERALTYARRAHETIANQRSRIAHLEALTATDELTGLLNRRGFTEALDRALANARRHDEEGLLVIADLDGFKPVNDRHGHAAGDALLRHVADFLRERTRTTDYLARIGGDEFALLMVNGALGPARQRAMALKDALNAAIAEIGVHRVAVRASFGIAPYDRDTSAAQIMHMADMAMYHDKRRRTGTRTGPRPVAAE